MFIQCEIVVNLFEWRETDEPRCVGCGWTDDIDDTNTNNAWPVTCSPKPASRHTALRSSVGRNYSGEVEAEHWEFLSQ